MTVIFFKILSVIFLKILTVIFFSQKSEIIPLLLNIFSIAEDTFVLHSTLYYCNFHKHITLIIPTLFHRSFWLVDLVLFSFIFFSLCIQSSCTCFCTQFFSLLHSCPPDTLLHCFFFTLCAIILHKS